MKITFIGGGNMAQAIISGIKKNNINSEILVSEPIESKRKYLEKFYGIKTCNNNITAIKNSDFIILAIKPQIFPDIAEEINSYLGPYQTLVSIMAGITLVKLNEYLKKDFNSLSYGEQRWIDLAIAIASDTKVLLIDGFGQYLGSDKINLLSRILYKKINYDGVTVIVCTHIRERLSKIASVFIKLDHGKIVSVRSHKKKTYKHDTRSHQ